MAILDTISLSFGIGALTGAPPQDIFMKLSYYLNKPLLTWDNLILIIITIHLFIMSLFRRF